MSTIKKHKNLIILVLVIALVIGYILFSGKEDTWEGVYFPEGCLTCKNTYFFSPGFTSPVACMNWANRRAYTRKMAGFPTESDQADCGRNCKWKASPSIKGFPTGPLLWVCKETFPVSI